jgi:hypothetical protein
VYSSFGEYIKYLGKKLYSLIDIFIIFNYKSLIISN